MPLTIGSSQERALAQMAPEQPQKRGYSSSSSSLVQRYKKRCSKQDREAVSENVRTLKRLYGVTSATISWYEQLVEGSD